MKNNLEVFRSLNFDGCIHVRLRTTHPADLITYFLYRNGTLIEQKSITCAETQVTFYEQTAGDFRVVAEITASGHTHRLSRDLKVKPQRQLLKSRKQLSEKSKITDVSHACDNLHYYFLEIQFAPGGLEKFHNERDRNTPFFSDFKSQHLAGNARTNQAAIAPVFPAAVTARRGYGELSRLYQLVASGSFGELRLIANELEALDYVEFCSLLADTTNMAPPELVTEPLQTMPEEQAVGERSLVGTPDFSSLQQYLDAERGMNVRTAWQKGETGRFATIHFLDFGVYRDHEDLQGNINVVSSRDESVDCNHGTASVGCIVAKNNAFGVTGIAYDSELNFYDAGDLDLIVQNAQPGDIVGLNLQLIVNNYFLPWTYSHAAWNRINEMTRNGVIVALAAGNGNVNLSPQAGIMPDYGDDGSMMVGAIIPDSGRRASYSNFNHPTSLICAWGSNVCTTGYGDLQKLPGNNHNYLDNFGGTSSATPIATGALALIQSYAKRQYGVYLDGLEMRDLIAKTGRSEGVGDGVGYQPDIVAAMAWLDAYLQPEEEQDREEEQQEEQDDKDPQDLMPVASVRVKATGGSELNFTVLLPDSVDAGKVGYQWLTLARETISAPNEQRTSIGFPVVTKETPSQITLYLTGAYQASLTSGLVIVPAGEEDGQESGSDDTPPLYPLWNATQPYTGGDRVSHKGSHYLAKWWVAAGVEPGLESTTGGASGDAKPWTKI